MIQFVDIIEGPIKGCTGNQNFHLKNDIENAYLKFFSIDEDLIKFLIYCKTGKRSLLGLYINYLSILLVVEGPNLDRILLFKVLPNLRENYGKGYVVFISLKIIKQSLRKIIQVKFEIT